MKKTKAMRQVEPAVYVEPDNFPYFCEYDLHNFAEQENYEDLKTKLEEYPEYVNFVNTAGYTPLAVVVKTRWEVNTTIEKKIMELLLSYGADPMMPHFDGKLIAAHAFLNGEPEVLMLFARYLEDIDTILEGCPPLYYAITQGETELVKYCLNRNADVHLLYPNNKTILHVAVSTQNYSHIPLLLEYGCNVNARTDVGNTSLHIAVQGNNGHAAVKSLIRYNADLNAQNYQGDTPLNVLARQSYFNYASFEQLIKAGCNVNIPDNEGFTPLHKISYHFRFGKYDKKFRADCRSFVRTLLRRGANAFALTNYDETVVDTAIRNNRLELAEIMIKHITPRLLGRYQQNDPMIYSFERHPKYRSIAKKCIAEHSKLDTLIGGTNLSYKDLINNYRKVVKYATDEDVANELKFVLKQRSRLVKDVLCEECKKVLIMAQMHILLTEIFEYILPSPCIENIMKYINPSDCNKICELRIKPNRRRNFRRYI